MIVYAYFRYNTYFTVVLHRIECLKCPCESSLGIFIWEYGKYLQKTAYIPVVFNTECTEYNHGLPPVKYGV